MVPTATVFGRLIIGADGDGDGDDNATAGFQSILDAMTAFLDPVWSLDWHYRSHDETLIAYSNHRIYNGRLVTFPGPGCAGAIRHELVPHTPGQGAQEAERHRGREAGHGHDGFRGNGREDVLRQHQQEDAEGAGGGHDVGDEFQHGVRGPGTGRWRPGGRGRS